MLRARHTVTARNHAIMSRLSHIIFAGTLALLAGCPAQPGDSLRVTGQIEGNAVSAGSRTGGRVVAVPAAEGQRVTQGAVLVRLEADEAQAALAAAQAQLKRAEAMLAKAERGATAEQLAQAEAAVSAAEERYAMVRRGAREEEKAAARAATAAARAQRDQARREFERAERLLAEEAIAQRIYDQADTAYAAARAQYDAAREQEAMVNEGARAEEVAMVRADLDRARAALAEVRAGATKEDLDAARAVRDAAAADLERARVALRETQVRAPVDGVVESIDVRPGDLLGPGPAVKLIDPDDLEVVIYVSAARLGDLRVGQDVPFTADAHGASTFTGTITHIANEGEFTPRNLQTQESRVQQVFGVTLALDSADGRLRPGMTITAQLPAASGA